MSESERAPVSTALIVAGGRGTRLQPLTHDTPKPLIPFCAAPFLEGVLIRLARAGVRRVFLVVGAETDPFRSLGPSAERLGLDLQAVPEPEPLDTAGGVRAVADQFDGPVLVLNGDILTDVDYAAVGAAHVGSGGDATIVLTRVEDTSSFGVAVIEDGRIVDFVEKPAPGSLLGHDTVNAGTYVLEPTVLRHHAPGRLSFERDVFPGLLERGRTINGYVWNGAWQDLGTPDRYLTGHRHALDRDLRWPTLEDVPERSPGVHVAAGASVDPTATLVAPVLLAPGARVDARAEVGPYVVLGQDVTVGEGARLRDAVLHERARVGADVEIRELVAAHDVVVEAGTSIGREVVLGPGEVVEAGDEVADGGRRPRPAG